MSRKKIGIILIVVVFAAIVLWGGYQFYAYNHPELSYVISRPDWGNDLYIEGCTISIKETSVFGCNEEINRKMKEVVKALDDKRLELYEQNKTPMHLSLSISFKDNTTLISYVGYVTDEAGNRKEINDTLAFDGIITRNVN